MVKDIRSMDGYELQETRVTGTITRGLVVCPCGREVRFAMDGSGECENCKRRFAFCADTVGVRVFQPDGMNSIDRPENSPIPEEE